MVEAVVQGEKRESQPLYGKTVVISGVRQGIGKAIAFELMDQGCGVVGSYVRERSEKQEAKFTSEVQAHGENFISIPSDVTDPEGRLILLRTALAAPFSKGGIDILVLNAAGGFEKDKPAGWADLINHQAQIAMVDEYLPYINPGGEIVFITSHWAHGYGQVRMLPYYGEIARTKNDVENSLMGKLDELTARRIKLGRISAPLVKGTGAYSILEHLAKEQLLALEQKMGGFPEADEVGKDVCDFLLSPHQSGDIYYVRGYSIEPLPEEHTGVRKLDRSQIEELLPMYSNLVINRVMVDEFESSEDRKSGTAWYTARDEDCKGHFREDWGGPVLPAHVRLEIGAQAVGLALISYEPDAQGLGTLNGLSGETDFTGHGKGGLIFPGDKIRIQANITSIKAGTDIEGSATMYVGDNEVTSFERIHISVIPSKTLAVRSIERARRRSDNIKQKAELAEEEHK